VTAEVDPLTRIIWLLEEAVAVHERRLRRAEGVGTDDEVDLLRLDLLRARLELERVKAGGPRV
jgi:hypothetical protein